MTDATAPPPAPSDRTTASGRGRPWATRIGLALALSALLTTLALGWLLGSGSGRDALLAQLRARLPAGIELHWSRAEGNLGGALTLHDLHLLDRTCPPARAAAAPTQCDAARTTSFSAKRLTIVPRLGQLLRKRLSLETLIVQDAQLNLPTPEDEPFTLPRWPDALPRIALPLAVHIDGLHIDRLRIDRAGARLIQIRRLRGGLAADDGHLHLERLQLDSDLGRFTAHGDYTPAANYRTDLRASAVFPTAAAGPLALRRSPARIGLIARGDLSDLVVGIGGDAPGPIRARLQLGGDPAAPRWSLRADIDRLDPAALAGRAPSPQPIRARFDASGVGGDATVQGQFEQGDLQARIQPSRIQSQNQILAFDPLTIDIMQGRIRVRGRGDFRANAGDGRLRYAVDAKRLRLGDAPSLDIDAQLGIAGTQAAWAVVGQASLTRAGERAAIRIDGRGDRRQLRLNTLAATLPSGRLDASGAFGWSPRLHWTLDAKLAGFDPGYFANGWPGAIDADIRSQGRARADTSFDAGLRLTGIGGYLRKRTLGGQAEATLAGQRLDAALQLAIGDGRLRGKAEATLGDAPRWQAEASLRRFDPGLALDGWNGAIDAELRSTGHGDGRGDLYIDLTADELGGELRGRKLDGRVNATTVLPKRGDTRLDGQVALRLGDSRITAKGALGDTLDIDARLEPLRLDDLLPGAGGRLYGRLHLAGARRAPTIDAALDGDGLRHGQYQLGRLRLHGRLPWRDGDGRLSLEADEAVAAGIALERLQLEARGAVERLQLDAHARSPQLGVAQVAGHARKRGDTWDGALERLHLQPMHGPDWRLRAPMPFHQRGNGFTLADGCFDANPSGALCLRADWPRDGLHLHGTALPLALAAPYLPLREDGRRWALSGQLDLTAALRPAADAWTGRLQLRSAAGGLRNSAQARRDIIGYRDLRLDADFDPQRIQANLAATMPDDGRIDAALATGWDAAAPLSGRLTLDIRRLLWLEMFSPDVVDPSGSLSGQLGFGGTLGAPTIDGQARLSGFSAEIPALNIALRDGNLQLEAQPDGSARLSGALRSGDGTLNLDGRLNWRDGDAPLTLDLRGRNVLAADTRDLRAIIDPELNLSYQAGQPLRVSGTVVIPEADLHLEHLGGEVTASSDVVVLDPVDPEQSADAPLALDLTLAMGENVTLGGFGLHGRLGGKLRVRAMPGREMAGNGNLDIQGQYKAYGQDLHIRKGALRWNNSPISDPILDIKAERSIGDVVAGITVTGRVSAPDAKVYSNQGGSQSDALAYLTLGRPLSSLGRDESSQINAASAALSAGGGMLASQLGARIGLDDAGVMQSRTAGSVFGIGKYLSPKVYVGYGVSLLGTGQVMMLKYLLHKGFDLQIESSRVENRGSINWRKEK